MAPRATQAVRLHPYPVVTTSRQSSIGGPLPWPVDDAWPLRLDCIESVSLLDGTGAEDLVLPMVPLLQIFAPDVRRLPYPTGCDLLQVLWCPAELPGRTDGTRLAVRRDLTRISGVRAEVPVHDGVAGPAQWGRGDVSNPTALVIQSYGNLSVFCCTTCPDRLNSMIERCG